MVNGENATPTNTGETGRGIDRRTILKGAAIAGLGASAVGTASAQSGGQELPNTLIIRGGGVADYEFTVSGEVALGPNAGGGEDRIVGSDTAIGRVGDGGIDDFTFSGQVTSFEADGPVDVFVNGERVDDPVGLPRTELPNTVTIEGATGTVNYAFRVSGSVEAGETADAEDTIDGDTVRGAVGSGGADSFRYSGSITFDSDGPLTVTLDIDK